MAENKNTPEPTSPDNTPPKPRKRRLLLKALLAIVIVLVLLVALAPWIASTSLLRGIVLGKVNDQLNGKVTLSDLSLGWMSSTKMDGLVVTDAAGRKLLSLDHLTTGITVLDVVKGNFNLGDVTIDGLHFDLVIDENGKTNADTLAKPSAPSTASPASPPSTPTSPSAPAKLPNVSGNIKLVNSGGTIEKAGLAQPVSINLDGSVKIPDINSPIEHSLNVGLQIGKSPAGTISLGGTVAAIKNNLLLQPTEMTVNEKLTLKGIEAASIQPFLPATLVNQIAGTTNGDVVINLTAGKGGTLDGQIITTGILVKGPALKGDEFKISKLTIAIPAVAFNVPQDAKTLRISVGAQANSKPFEIAMDQGSIQLRADTSLTALQNLAASLPPGDTGSLRADLNFDIKKLADQMPHTLALLPDVKIDSANLSAFTDIKMTEKQAVLTQHVGLPDGIAATRQGTAVKVSPLALDMSATDLGKAGASALPIIHDVKLALDSAFATANIQGASLAAISGKANADLAKLRQELGQIVDLGQLQLQGTFDADLATTGDLANDSAPIDLTATATLHDLQVKGIANRAPVNQPWLQAKLTGKLQRKNDAITGVNPASVSIRTGNDQNPTVDIYAIADASMASGKLGTANFELQRLNVDLVKAQGEFGGLIGMQQGGPTIRSGSISGAAKGSFDGSTAKLANLEITPVNLTVSQGSSNLLDNYSTKVSVAGSFATAQKQLSLDQFAIDDGGKLLTIRKSDAPMTVKLSAGAGWPQVNAKLQLTAQLAALMNLVDAMKPPSTQPAAADAKPIKWTSGVVASEIDVATDEKSNAVTLNIPSLTANNLALTHGDGKYAADPITIKATAVAVPTATGSLQDINVSALSLDSGLATITMPQPIVVKNVTGLLAALNSTAQASAAPATASGTVRIAGDLAKIKAFLDAFQATAPGQGGQVAGTFDIQEGFGTQGSAVSLKGAGAITNLKLTPVNSTTPFTESAVKISNDIAMDSKADSLTITGVSVSMESSKALGIDLKGAIQSLSKDRTLQNVTLGLNYDAAKLWQIIRPFLPPKTQQSTADWVVAGVQQRSFTINGAYTPDLKKLTANGGIGMDTFQGDGLDVQKCEIPIALASGILTISAPSGQNAQVNTGVLSLADIKIDLSTKTPSSPLLNVSNLHLTKNVALNPVLAKNVLKFSPLFADADQAAGLLNIDITNAKDLALTDLTSVNSGHADLTLEVANVQLLNKLLAQILGGQTLTGHIYTKQLTLDKGVVTEDLIFQFGDYPLEFQGGVGLAKLDLQNFSLIVPAELLTKINPIMANLKGGVPITLTGTATNPTLDLKGSVANFVQRNGKDAAIGVVEGLLNKNKNTAGQQALPNNQSSSPTQDIEGALGNLIGGKSKSQPNPPPQNSPRPPMPSAAPAPQPPIPPPNPPPSRPEIAAFWTTCSGDRQSGQSHVTQSALKTDEPRP